MAFNRRGATIFSVHEQAEKFYGRLQFHAVLAVL